MFGVFDMGLFVQMAIATVLQSEYIPHSSSECKDAETWQVSGNGTESFFHVMGALNDPAISAEQACVGYVEEWKYAVVCV